MTEQKPRLELPKLTKEQRIGSAVIPGLTDPDQLAAYKIKAFGRSLAPDDPMYGVTVGNLGEIALNNPGIEPDDALAMLTGGLTAGSEVGIQLTAMRQQLAAVEAQNRQVAQDNYIQQEQDEESWYGSLAKGVTRFAFAAMGTPKEILDNGFRTTLRYLDGNNDVDFPTTVGQMFANTTTARMAEGFFTHWFDTSDIDPQYDFGSTWFPEYETQGAETLRQFHTKQYLGSELNEQGKEAMVWDAEANDGKGAYRWRDQSSVGQIIVERSTKLDPTSAAYGPLSGLVDAMSYLLDPSIFVPFGTTGKMMARLARPSLGGPDDVAKVAGQARAADPYRQLEETFGDVSRQWDEFTEAEKARWMQEHGDPTALEAQQKLLAEKTKLLESGELEQARMEVLAERLAPLQDAATKSQKAAEKGEQTIFVVDQTLASRGPDIDEVAERLEVLRAEEARLIDQGQSPTNLVEDPLTQAEQAVTGAGAAIGQEFMAARGQVGSTLGAVLRGEQDVEAMRGAVADLVARHGDLGPEAKPAADDVIDMTDDTLAVTGEAITDVPMVTRAADTPGQESGLLDQLDDVARQGNLEPGFYADAGKGGMYWTGAQFITREQYDEFLSLGGKPIVSQGKETADYIGGLDNLSREVTEAGISDPRIIVIQEEIKSLQAMRELRQFNDSADDVVDVTDASGATRPAGDAAEEGASRVAIDLTPEELAKLDEMRLSDGTPIGDLMKDVAELKLTIAGLSRTRQAMDEALAETYKRRDEARAAYENAARVLRDEAGGGSGGGKGGRGAAGGADDEDPIEWVRSMVGTINEGGVERIHLNRALRFITGQKGDSLVKYLASVDDGVLLWNMTRGKWPASLAEAIAKTDSEDEVRNLLAAAIADGGLHTGTMKARTLNAAARGALKGRDPNSLVRAYRWAWGVSARVMNYGLNRKVSNVPWAHAYNTENLDDMVSGVSDMVGYVYRFNPWSSLVSVARKRDMGWVRAREAHDKYVGMMLKTTTAAERRRVYYEVVSDMTREMGRRQGWDVDSDVMKQFMGVMKISRARAEQAVQTLAEARASASQKGAVELMGVDPKQWTNMNPATLEGELQFSVLSPDWQQMQRAMKSAKDVLKAYGGGQGGGASLKRVFEELNDKLFERYWRTAVLAFRGGYVLRNIADMQVRMYLAGHPSLFTNPAGILALATANRKNGKLLEKLKKANLDTLLDENGKVIEFTTDFDNEVLGEAVDVFRELASRTSSMADPVIAEARRVKHAGWKELTPESGNYADFLRGWVNELQVMAASSMAREVLRVKYGRTSDTIVDWAQRHGMSHEDAVVDYFWNGPGRAHGLDPMIQSNSSYKELFEGKGMQRADAPEGEMIQGVEALRALFWGGGSANYASRWERLTNGGDTGILDILLTPREGKRKNVKSRDVGGEPLLRTAQDELVDPDDDLLRQLRSLTDVHGWNTTEGRQNLPVKAVRVAQYEDVAGAGVARKIESLVDAFFSVANATEKNLGYLPEFRFAKWDAAANYIRALSPEDAQKLIGIAEQALGGKGVPLSWRRRTLAKMKREAEHASGSGAFNLDDMKHVTDQVGIDHIKRNFYDAQKRNQFGYALRYVIPFGQAFANTLETWTRLAFQNPQRVYGAGVLYRAGTGAESNWLMDDPSNPEDSWIFTDPNSGQSMLGIPVVGQLMTRLANVLPGPDVQEGAFQMHSPVQSGNLIFQNGLMPGFGPMIQIPAQMFESTEAYQAIVPDPIKRAFIPYVNVDPNRDRNLLEMFTPGWVNAIASGIGIPGYDNGVKKHIQPAMGMLYAANPEKYPHNEMGMLSEDGQRLLLEDATAVAHRLEFWRGAFMNLMPTALMGDFLVQTDDPARMGSQAIMAVEYQELMSSQGSREQALLAMADKYGADAMVSLMSDNKYHITPTGEAYDAVKENPELARNHASVFSLIFPGGGYSPYMDRWNRKGYGNIKLTDDEKLDTANQLLKTLAQAQLDRKLINNEISQEAYDYQSELMQQQMIGYPTPDTDTRGRENTIKSLRDAVADPTLGATPAGKAINEYLQARDYAQETGGWGGDSGAVVRAQMRLIGEDIVRRYPEFRVAWLRLFRAEIMQSEKSEAEIALEQRVASGTGPLSMDEVRSTVTAMNDNIRANGKPRAQDGDTIEMPDGSYVRLVGIDTVEKGEAGYGRSGRFTQNFIDKGPLQLENPTEVDDEDPYGRLIRYVLVNNRDLGLALIRRGIARPFYDSESDISGHTYQEHPKQEKYHKAFEKNNEQWLGSDGE